MALVTSPIEPVAGPFFRWDAPPPPPRRQKTTTTKVVRFSCPLKPRKKEKHVPSKKTHPSNSKRKQGNWHLGVWLPIRSVFKHVHSGGNGAPLLYHHQSHPRSVARVGERETTRRILTLITPHRHYQDTDPGEYWPFTNMILAHLHDVYACTYCPLLLSSLMEKAIQMTS